MTEQEQQEQQELERIKSSKGLTDKQALDYLQGQNMSPEELEKLRLHLKHQMENPYIAWGTFDSSKIFKQ